MLQILAIAGGGALGSLARFWVSTGIYQLFGRSFPWGTLVVNVSGSFVMGFLFVLFLERLAAAPEWRAAVLVGFLGAYTTFSTFEYETGALLKDGEWLFAGLNVVLSVIVGFVALKLGEIMAKSF